MMPLSLPRFVLCWMRLGVTAVIIGLLTKFGLAALTAQTVDTQSSFSDKIELADPKSLIVDAVSDTENLLKQNLILQEQVKSISEALVEAKSEADTAQAENREVKARIEALGLNAIGSDRSKLEQRLIKAINELNGSQAALAESKKNLASLTEAVLSLLKSSRDVSPEARLVVETELRKVNRKTADGLDTALKAEPAAASLSNARIISIKPDIGLIIGNIGADDSVKIGMPFRIYDGQKVIALARVVDVREKLFGALIQETLSDKNSIKVGHRLKIDAN